MNITKTLMEMDYNFYIEYNLGNNRPLEDISKYAGLSKLHFRNVFLMFSGMTVVEYIKEGVEGSMDFTIRWHEDIEPSLWSILLCPYVLGNDDVIGGKRRSLHVG